MVPLVVSQITRTRTERWIGPRVPSNLTKGNREASEHCTRMDFSLLRLSRFALYMGRVVHGAG